MTTPSRRFELFAWGNVVYNLAVIVWGAFVRATGSGAGCGEHWPTCNGEVIPWDPGLETAIEFTHRLTSGLALVLAVLLFVWARRVWPKGSAPRKAAGFTLGFMVGEALVGAAIVLLALTGLNDSVGRAAVMGVHLVNTLLLVGALVLTAWLSGGRAAPRVDVDRPTAGLLGATALGMMVLGATGAITALGDTLFPAESLAAGLADDLSPTAHVLVRLRVIHPVLAVLVGGLGVVSGVVAGLGAEGSQRRAGLSLAVLVGVQLLVGVANIWLLAPVWMQLVHLLVADFVWIALVLTAATALAPRSDGLGAAAA